MGLEYVVTMEEKNEIRRELAFSLLLQHLKKAHPQVQLSEDKTSIWAPIHQEGWISYSIEKTEEGLFMVSYLSLRESNELLQIIANVLIESSISYTIEDA